MKQNLLYSRQGDIFTRTFYPFLDHQTFTYPPYNIIKGEDKVIVEMAVAGFKKEDIKIKLTHETGMPVLCVSADATVHEEDDKVEYIHRGLAKRSFTRKFNLASNMMVSDEPATIEDGVLRIVLIEDTSNDRIIKIE